MVVVALQAKGKTGSFQYMGLEPLGSMWRKMKLLSPPTLHYASGLMIYIYENAKLLERKRRQSL